MEGALSLRSIIAALALMALIAPDGAGQWSVLKGDVRALREKPPNLLFQGFTPEEWECEQFRVARSNRLVPFPPLRCSDPGRARPWPGDLLGSLPYPQVARYGKRSDPGRSLAIVAERDAPREI